jgi:hypothetical protein
MERLAGISRYFNLPALNVLIALPIGQVLASSNLFFMEYQRLGIL